MYSSRKFYRLIWKDPDAGKDWGQEEKGMTEDEMVGWPHWLNGLGFGWTPGVGDRQGGLACCSSWGRKESDMTEQLNWNFPALGSFSRSLLFISGRQSVETSASASVLPMIIQGWFPLGLTSLISLQSKGLSAVFSSTAIPKHPSFGSHPSLWSNSHMHTYMTTKKVIALTVWTFVAKWYLCFLVCCLVLLQLFF